MACARQSAVEFLKNARRNLVTHMKDLPLIIENLYQKKVFNEHEVDALKAERTEFDKARCILDWVINKGEEASYELLRILDVIKKRTLHPDLHSWICCFPFRWEEEEVSLAFGTKPCQNYQSALKKKAKRILKDQRERCCKYPDDKAQGNFHFIPVVLERDSVVKTPQCKIKWKNRKCKKLRPKKLRAYIPTEKQTLSPVDLLRCQEKSILLIGKPGIGKTTVVQEVLRLWAEKEDRELDYMFYFDEGVLAHSSSVDDLESFLFKVYLKPMDKDRKDVFQDIEEYSENVVIVFDGVTCVQENSVLEKIMDHELLPEAKIIITCRSEVEDEPLFNWPTLKVYVQGFSEASINTYYQKKLGHDPDLLDVVLKNQELFSLSHVPMYAFMIVTFIPFKNDTDFNDSHTVTEMYIHIFRLALKKHKKMKTVKQIDKYLIENKDHVHLLMEDAYNATKQKTLNLPDISSYEDDMCHVFLKMITTTDSLSSATTYCAFLHNTMQEFFSALWLLGHPDEIEKVLQLCQTEESKHMKHVLPFLCGLLGEHNIKLIKCLFPEDQIKKTSDWFIEKFLETFLQTQSESEEFDLLYVCQCLYELQSPKACFMFLEKMDHQLEPEEDLDPHQCCALAYVITQSRDKEVYLNLEDCNMTDAGMNMMLSCSPKIRLKVWKEPLKQISFFREFFHKASLCSCSFFAMRHDNNPKLCDILLDLCSHVKNFETQTGRSFLPALQSVFQSPDVWIIDLSQRKTSVLLEVLKLQTEKKPVELRGCSEEEREMKSFLQCLSYISQLRFRFYYYNHEEMKKSAVKLLLNLSVAAGENVTVTGTRFSTLLSSVCSYKTFPFDLEWYDDVDQCDFLLDLCSHVKNYETQTGRSFLPALQSVFQSPDVWVIDLSQRKTSVLLEVLKLQTEKKPVDLRGCPEEESEMKSFLQCLSYISQLRFDYMNISLEVQFLLRLLTKAAETETQTGEQMLKLLSSVCTYTSFPYQETDIIKQSDFLLDLYSHVKNYETQTGRSFLPALQSVFQSPDVWIIDLSQRKTSVLLEVLKLQTKKKPVELRGCSEEESEMKSFRQCLSYISQLRASKESLQKLVECVYEAQEEELTQHFLQKVGGDLTSCSLSWEELHYFLQHRIQQITVNFRKSDIQRKSDIREILPFLNRIRFKRMSSVFMLSVITEIYESRSVGSVSGLLSSVQNYISLQSRDLDSVHCAALRFTLQHCTAVSLDLLWTFIPEEELESIVPLFRHVSRISVDRLLLLKMLHCCSVSDVQQEFSSVLLSVLQHKLDFSCRSALDLTTHTHSETLHLTTEDCRVMTTVIQRAHTNTQLILQDCEIHTAGMDQLFPVLHAVKLCCDKPLLLQFLARVSPEEAESLSGALGDEVDLSQTPLEPQVCRGLALILEYSEGLTDLDLSQCRLTDPSLDLLLTNLHKAQNIDFSGNRITDTGAQRIYSVVCRNSDIKTVRLFNNRIESRELFLADPRFEIW
ncbi:uncharacterized protein LOC120473071 isoform X2 [Pimephales promelas]|uniref:uncharacterized protein LOC120473071 isoform X2 n=1 Tax=Pimephales promelas TaxID=90988 RepID=UPI001955E142|nr:uncharacterized protein LOC120473071 isoform X2 [Pimephales promelas]